jgi:hypothetical protein
MAWPPVGLRAVLGPFRRLAGPGPLLTPRRVTGLLVFGLVGFQVVVALSAPLWARLLRRPVGPGVAAEAEDAETPEPPTPSPAQAGDAERRINVKLFFEAVDRPGLVIEERTVAYSTDLSRQLEIVLRELVRGSDGGLGGPIDPATRVLDVFVSAQGCAYVDLSPEVRSPQGAGSQAELDTVYSMVNTLTVNFPAVTRVQLLVADRPVDTLAGHTDLSRPLTADMTLLAPAVLMPVQPDAPSPGGAPPSPQQ